MKLSHLLAVAVATLLSFTAEPMGVHDARAQEIYRDNGVVMGYVAANETASTDGYDTCFTSVGDYLRLHSDNSANLEPFYQIRASGGRVSVTKNNLVDGRGVYVCYNSRGTARKVKAGYVTSGTSIGAGLNCVLSVANLIKLRQAGAGTGTVSCAYDRNTGVITASQTGAGRITNCGYVCADPANTTSSQLLSLNSTSTSGTRIFAVKGDYTIGTNTLFSRCSNTFITEAAYNSVTGAATQGRNDGCGYAMFSYLWVSGAQCADGVDNDGDGLLDRADPGCWSNPLDPNSFNPNLDHEGAATSQCQNGVDDDRDGLVDLVDPGCANPQDNNEGDGTSQCQNGVDDDKDGLTDLVDPGCANPQDNNEADGTSQCQNGVDDDRDGLIDLVDPGCANPQDNNEGDGTSQCQNGVDDDKDGLTDLVDPGCANPQDNNEADGTSQCQNGVDDDKDGLTDLVDPGCANPQDNNEADGTSQCQNGVDDDRDGLIDLVDPGCANPQDNNEGDGTSQCQNGVDDDKDGLTDLVDPGCANPQDNNEADGTSQCQNGVDDDKDGLTDLVDPGCANPQDNNEADGTSQCQNGVDDDKDGLIDLADPGCSSPQDKNEGDEVLPTPTPTSTPTGAPITTAYKVTPIVECVDALQNGNLLAHFGYKSDEATSVTIPVGQKNYFSPGSVDTGQPTTFYRGAFGNVHTAIVPVATPQAGGSVTSSVLRWTLGDATVEASTQTTRCSGGQISCNETDNKDTLTELDNLAARQRANVRSLANRIRSASSGSGYNELANSYESEAKALYLEQWTTIWSKFPQVTKSCVGCTAIETTSSIAEITARSKKFLRLTKLAAATLKKARRGSLKSSDEALVSTGTSLYNRTLTVSEQLPRFDSQCG